jgi:acyl homoserine lactone synthase
MPVLYKSSLDRDPETSNLHIVQTAPRVRFHIVRWMDAQYGDLLRQYHHLRKKVFVDTLKWNLPVHDGMEWDQYDSPRATYILIEEDGICVGGCRMLRCDHAHTIAGTTYSYMLRDAHLGLLPGFPPTVIDNPPVSAEDWEMTRAISGRNPRQFRDLWNAQNDFVKSQNGSFCTVITRPAVIRLASMWGYEINPMGPITRISESDWQAVRLAKP